MLTNRLLKLHHSLRKSRLDALLVSSIPNIIYLTGFTGFSKDEREAYLIFVAQPQGLTHGYLLTDNRYSEEVKKVVKDFEILTTSSLNSFNKHLKRIVRKEKIKRLGFEKNNLTVGELEKISALADQSVITFIPTERIIENLRAIKEPIEIETIQKACALTDKTFDYILTKIKPGITEIQLAFELEFFIKKNGADISFPPIVAFGVNSAVPHHQTSNTILSPSTRSARSGREGQIVLLDFGVKFNNYCSDITRVVFLGKARPKQKRVYKTVLAAQQKAIEHLGGVAKQHLRGESQHKTPRGWPTCPERSRRKGLPRGGGINASEIDKIARDYITSQDYPPIPHGLGHGIGLEVHEKPRLSPKSTDILKPGMVFSLEPGIYLPRRSPEQNRKGEGGPDEFGIRIEDLVLITETGPKILTHSPKEIIEI